MIIRSKERAFSSKKKKNVPVWVLDTDDCIVKHFDAKSQTEMEKKFSSEHIRYHLHYSTEYHLDRLKELINNGTILCYLTKLDHSVTEALERQVEKWKTTDKEYLEAVAIGDFSKADGLENMFRLCAREPIYAAIVYV